MKYSPELVEEIIGHMKKGSSNKDACILAGISEETFYRWQRPFLDDEQKIPNPEYKGEFCELLKKTETLRKQSLINKVITDKSWQSSAWYLERQFNDEFGEKKKIEVSDPQDKIKRIMGLIKQSVPEKKEEDKKDEPIPTDGSSVLQGQDGEPLPDDAGTE